MMARNNNQFIPLYKIMVPILYGLDSSAAITTALSFTGARHVVLAGFVCVDDPTEYSRATSAAQRVRRNLSKLSNATGSVMIPRVRVGLRFEEELMEVIQDLKPDTLILQWPEYFNAICTNTPSVLNDLPCDLAVVRGPLSEQPTRVLVPVRGGPYAELALRLALAISNRHHAQLTVLHVKMEGDTAESELSYRGLAQVLKNLPEVEHQIILSNDPTQTILDQLENYDLVVLGMVAQNPDTSSQIFRLGTITERLFSESPVGVIAVKTSHQISEHFDTELSGQKAISVLVDRWFAENTFHRQGFTNLERLCERKQAQNLTISLALPALNEEATIGNVIDTLQKSLVKEFPLLDEIVVMDSDSTDRTREIAKDFGVPVYIHQHLLPEYGSRPGKGEALWKSLYVTSGDIILWVDTDIVNIHPRFVYNLAGPLLSDPDIMFVKGFYRRPLRIGEKIQAGGGGRVTELTARPLLNLFYPELSGIVQPLSGEYGGRRSVLEQLTFFSGYGVEIGLLIDTFEKFGLDAIAQVDLQERVHHNQPLAALSKMSFAIIQAVIRKLEKRYDQLLLEDVNQTMKLIRYQANTYYLDIEEIAEKERPPMASIAEYQQKNHHVTSIANPSR